MNSTGLFRGGIAKSGSSLCPWAYQRNYKLYAQLLVQKLTGGKIVNASSEDILKHLKTASAEDIMKHAPPEVSIKSILKWSFIFRGFIIFCSNSWISHWILL